MQYITYAILSWAILTVCGLPLAICLLPRHLRRLAIPVAPLFGYAYIAFVSFHLFRMNIGGSNLFAPYVALVPVVALIALAWYGRRSIAELFSRHAMLMTAMAWLSFAVLSLFYYRLGGGRAVAITMFNADLAEFMTLGRYMQEFARDTTIGFLGQSIHLQRESDLVWFGASMVPAVISSLTGSEPFRVQSLVMTLVGSQACAFVYAIARDSLAFNRATSVTIGVVYALSPVVAYMVWQSFGGQMISMALMFAIVYLVTNAQTLPPEPRIQFAYLPALVLLFSGLFVTYHFMIALVSILLGLYIAVLALSERSWKRLWMGAALLSASLLLTVALNPLRVAAVMEMLTDLGGGGMGWFLPWLSPDVQLGFDASKLLGFKDARLLGYKLNSLRIPGIIIAVALAAGTIWCLVRERGQQRRLAFVLGLAVPVLLLGFYYAVKEANDGVLGSYRSFKVTSMFLAFTLLALAVWFGSANLRKSPWKARLGALLAAVLVVTSVMQLTQILQRTENIYVPPDELMQIRKIESMDFVSGVDVMDDDWHDLYWAHYFLLRKPQAFQTFIYGGRVGPLVHPYRLQQSYPLLSLDEEAGTANSRPVALKRAPATGNPTAMGDIFVVPGASECVESYPITSRLVLCKPRPEATIAMTPGLGWWQREPTGRWSGQKGRDAEIFIDTPVERRIRLRAVYDQLSPGQTLTLSVNGAAVPAEVTSTELVSAPFALQPGRNIALFTANFDPEKHGEDNHTLGIKWSRVIVEPEVLQGASSSQ